MTSYRNPDLPTPALDFLRKVQVWQQAPGGTAGLAVAMPEGDEQTLTRILSDATAPGLFSASGLEQRARWWLIGYQQMNPPLTSGQAAELDAVIGRSAKLPHAQLSRDALPPHMRRDARRQRRRLVFVICAGVISVACGISAWALGSAAGSPQGSPPAAGAPANPGQDQQQGQLTDLQQFRADWNVPSGANAYDENPAGLVLLQDGLYYPAPWSVPAGDSGWAPDTTGTITGQPVIRGSQADVTDSDGNTWTVAVGQPFVLASNPQVVLRVLRDVTVQSMPQPHAIAVRTGL